MCCGFGGWGERENQRDRWPWEGHCCCGETIEALKKRLEAEITERADCVKKLDECVDGQQRTIVLLETKIVGLGRNTVALGKKLLCWRGWRRNAQNVMRSCYTNWTRRSNNMRWDMLSFLSCLYCFSPLTSFDLFQGR